MKVVEVKKMILPLITLPSVAVAEKNANVAPIIATTNVATPVTA